MKKVLSIFSVAALILIAASCNKNNEPKAIEITVQLTSENAALAVEGIPVELVEASGAATYEEKTDASGSAVFKVPVGSYSASTTYKTAENGEALLYSGSVNIVVAIAQNVRTVSAHHIYILISVNIPEISSLCVVTHKGPFCYRQP